jgi:hypothetical protein
VVGAFVIYPRIIDLPWELARLHSHGARVEHIAFFIYRYLFFCLLTWIALSANFRKLHTLAFTVRLATTFAITLCAYAVYVFISLAICKHVDCFTGLLLFQFVVTCLLCAFTGHIFVLYSNQRKQESEIERLKTENLQSRCEALTNQINPHFFFNALNGLSALVRSDKKIETLKYIHELSGVFRYILQSDKKGVVQLCDELHFLDSFRYLQEIRYGDNLRFRIDIPEEKKKGLLPVLSLLPLMENIVKHNVIDTGNPMEITLRMNDRNELVIGNPVRRKLDPAVTNGIGLKNLSDRFDLLLNKKIRIETTGEFFRVYLPLT